MTARQDLADFLRRRRALLRPVDAGLPEGTRRRTPGLRREEVAMLAGVSVDYYARLEQGRGSTPSVSVVTGIAQALQCDRDQRDHLFRLAGHPAPPRRSGRHVRPGLIALGHRLTDLPVVITTDLGEVLWCNPLGQALLGGLLGETPRERNVMRRWFTDPSARAMPREEWERISAAHVGDLRAAFTRRGGDEEVTALVEELQTASSEFARLWTLHDVGVRRSDRKTIVHPEVGMIRMRCEVLLTPEEDVSMLAFFPLEDTDAQEKLDLLRVIGTQVMRSS
ncbi:helix-turn-helix transcriptional regulator [Brachybacterium sacelli]|uniref:Transcriptional regulator with XRE-family HTH domain n=1 Tax=Brachybacterium sacelli TaxID=173364 RepID=A0ABS4X6C8_9MICO|nr:helix-turn-helix transcriptional regulator [Brachybacterium sacelli]MBP2384022.1 transcriptional regulator with XRE-family HTH domain [Brachybacterium sacelli]